MSDKDPGSIGSSSALQDQFKDEAEFEPKPSKAEREGLPPGYRMRADAHYVDNLTSRRERVLADASRGDADRADARDRTDRLLAQLAEDLATIDSAVAALSGDASRLARRVNVDLAKSQVWRATWALRANAILAGTARTQIRPRPLAFLLGQVRGGWAAECRLLGVSLEVQASDWNAVVSVDESSVIAGLTGAIIATIGVLGQPEGATLVLSAAAAGGELRTVEITQDDVVVAPQVAQRFFDATWAERPGGWIAGLGAAAAKAVAQQHGGDARFESDVDAGSTITLGFSRR
ncbi:MAG: hypothetical protein IT184_15415 [Acidobacteria bacterium]|nr:hypothetical protein [Acidobacteriota bacterium]